MFYRYGLKLKHVFLPALLVVDVKLEKEIKTLQDRIYSKVRVDIFVG